MEDLRWILLLVGALVIVAVYFSSRFEREDWVREREQFNARKPSSRKAEKKKPVRRQQTIRQESSSVGHAPVAHSSVEKSSRKEPQMTSAEGKIKNTKNIDSLVAPVMPVDEEDDVAIDFDPSVFDSAPGPASTSTATAEKDSIKDTNPVEEKIAVEMDEINEQETVKAASASEIPADVILTEKSAQEFSVAQVEIKKPEKTSEVRDEMPGLSIRPEIEDEITGVEIPADLAIAEAELHASLNKKTQHSVVPESASAEMTLPANIEPLVLVLTIMSEDESFTGQAVKEALEAEGLRHGEMRIFHYIDGVSDETESNDVDNENALPIFSAASLVEPGYFDLDKIDEMEIPGITLFCQLPGSQSGEDAFNLMLDKGRGAAVRLHGQLCDDKRNRFTTQAKTHYQDRISTFTRELSVARKKAGV